MFSFLVPHRRAVPATSVVVLSLLAMGCGGSSDKEIEIVAPQSSIPVQNINPKAPMANISPENEAQHPEIMKGATIPTGKR